MGNKIAGAVRFCAVAHDFLNQHDETITTCAKINAARAFLQNMERFAMTSKEAGLKYPAEYTRSAHAVMRVGYTDSFKRIRVPGKGTFWLSDGPLLDYVRPMCEEAEKLFNTKPVAPSMVRNREVAPVYKELLTQVHLLSANRLEDARRRIERLMFPDGGKYELVDVCAYIHVYKASRIMQVSRLKSRFPQHLK